MPLTRIQTQNLQEGAVTNQVLSDATEASFATTESVAQVTASLATKVTTVNVANSSFAILDDTAVNVGGGYIVLTGENFQSGATVLIDTIAAPSVTRVNSTTLRVQVPPKSAASYNLFVINPDGGTGIRVAGITYSGTPTWVTSSPLDEQNSGIAFNLNFNATGATTYAVESGSTLPAGTQLLANGYFYGTSSVESSTTFSFNVVAIDAELQDSPKTFGLTVTVIPPRLIYALGGLSYGATGNTNGSGTFLSPTQTVTTTDWSEITMVNESVLAIKQNSTLWAWGKNNQYRLGIDNRTENISSPTQIGTDTNWSKVFVSGYGQQQLSVFAIKKNGTLWAWGNNIIQGQTGLNFRNYRSSPIQVGTNTNWSDVLTIADNSTLAIKTDGTLWAWGGNSYGLLGLNLATDAARSSPVQVGALTNWSRFVKQSTSEYRGAKAIKTDGTLWTIGGFNNTQNADINILRSSPVQYGTDTNWSTAALASFNIIAIKTNGTMWALGGGNGNGELGLNDRVVRSSSVQIGTGTNWSKVFGNGDNSFHAIKTDGTLWAWGSNYEYLGFGNYGAADHRSSPAQVGSLTGWVSVRGEASDKFLTRDVL